MKDFAVNSTLTVMRGQITPLNMKDFLVTLTLLPESPLPSGQSQPRPQLA